MVMLMVYIFYNGNVELSGSASMYGNIYSFSGNVVINDLNDERIYLC